MLITLSPAKKLDWTATLPANTTVPALLDQAHALVPVARALSVADLMRLMKISESLAVLNHDRFAAFSMEPRPEDARAAVRAFAGDTYTGLDAASLDPEDLDWAQDRLRILSGLYGVLRPLDLMQAYRLEMGSKLETDRGRDLYAFWGDRIAQALNDAATAVGTDIVVNCASVEYFTAVDRAALRCRVVTPIFLEDRDGVAKVVSFWAKRARGALARFVITNRLADPAALSGFETGGYCFDPDRSTPDAPVFVRAHPAQADAA